MIETHAHLYSSKFDADRDETIQRALDAGVQKFILPNIDSESVAGMLALEEAYPNVCYATMGVHPCHIDDNFEKELATAEGWLKKRNFTAIGEMGIDLYWDKTFLAQQKEAFKIHAQWAIEYDLPLIIHTRESMQETIALLEELAAPQLKGVVHCFTGNLDDAKRIIDLGFYLGIGGVSTYKKGGLDQVLPHIGLERLMLETDAPYLAPVPKRGKRNEPSYLTYISARVAELTSTTPEEAISKTTDNAKTLFNI